MVELKVKNGGFAVLADGESAGIIEYKSFWEGMPYLSLIKLLPEFRYKGIGKSAILLFEEEMRRNCSKAILVSTRADEDAQHFYRKLGYRECGCLLLDGTPFEQPMEMFFIKVL